MKRMAIVICTVIFAGVLLCLSGAATSHFQLGQRSQTFQRAISKTVTTKYLLFLPQDYGKREKRWPLILYLHGGSRRGDDIEMVRAFGLPQIVEKDPSFPFIVVSPQCPQGEIWTDTDTLISLLDEVMNKYAVDRERVYLTGQSMGGRGAWYLAYKYPERFAAVAPMAAPATISSWAANLKDMPIWVFHGAKDTDVPLSESEQMVNALKAVGNNVKFTIYPERDHFILDTYENKDLYKWFLQHKRVTK
jgi:predicted peptidase